jgi:hypothetical protein
MWLRDYHRAYVTLLRVSVVDHKEQEILVEEVMVAPVEVERVETNLEEVVMGMVN